MLVSGERESSGNASKVRALPENSVICRRMFTYQLKPLVETL